MKYISRITALLLVLMMLTPTFASALTLGTATQGDLNKLYQEASEDGVIYLSAGLLGHWSGLSAFGNLAYKDLYRFQWFNEDGQILPCFNDPWVTRVSNTMAEQKFYCVATDATGNELLSPVYVVPAADISNVEDYWSLLHDDRFLDALGAADTLTIYRLMTDIWNVSMPDGKNLAESVVAQWWSEREESYFDPYLLCSCVVSGAVASDECVLHPNSDLHVNGCSWKQPEISANVDVSTPESLLTLNSVVLAAEERPDVDAYAWQNYVYDPAIAGMRWAVVEYVQDTNLYTIQINKESIQTAYRVVIETTDYNLFESKPLYLGGYDFFNWILTNADIQAWMADDSVTLADVVARYNAAADEEDRTNTEDYTYGEEGESVNLKVPQGAFAEDYVMEFAEVAAERVEQLQNAVMAQMGATSTHVAQVLMALDISFASLANRANKLQPNAPVTLTFQVDTTGLDEALKYLYVYHIANDGTPEVVAGPIDAAFGVQKIVVQAEGFSTYLAMATNDGCPYCLNHEYCVYYYLYAYDAEYQYELLSNAGTENSEWFYDTTLDAIIQDYKNHIAAGEIPVLCTCKLMTMGELVAPGDQQHDEGCLWYGNVLRVIGLYGAKQTVKVDDQIINVGNYTYQWYHGDELIQGATSEEFEVEFTMQTETYYWEAKPKNGGDPIKSGPILVTAQWTSLGEYIDHAFNYNETNEELYIYLTETLDVDFTAVVDNVEVEKNLADEIMSFWYEKCLADEGYWYTDIFCTCVVRGAISSDECMLHPDDFHDANCPWYVEIIVNNVQGENSSVDIAVPDDAFEGVYSLNAALVTDTDVLAAVETAVQAANTGVGEYEASVLDAYDISFTNEVSNQPAQPVTMTFTVPTYTIVTTEKSGKMTFPEALVVYHLEDNGDGTYTAEQVGDLVYVDPMIENQVIEVQGTEFSIYVVGTNNQMTQITNSRLSLEVGETVRLYSDYTYYNASDYRWSYTNNGSFNIVPDPNNERYVTVTATATGTIQLTFQYYRSRWRTGESVTITATGPTIVTFNRNGGTGSNYTLEAQDGAFVFPTLAETGITPPAGAEFGGWATQSGNGGDTYAPGIQGTASSSVTYYAQWYYPDAPQSNWQRAYFFIRIDGEIQYEPASYGTQSYYPTSGEHTDGLNGGYIYTAIEINNNLAAVKANIAVEPTAEQIRRMGVTNFDPETQEVVWYVIKNQSSWHVDGVIRNKAMYEVAYHPNGGNTNVPGSNEYVAGATVTVNYTKVPSRQGYVFMGWDEDPNATTPTYVYDAKSPKTFEMPARDVDLYAIWRPSDATKYTVQHYLCDADGNNPQLALEQEKYGTTEATATAGYLTSFTGYEPYPQHAGTVASGVVAPDGSLVLKLYYKLSVSTLTIAKEGMEAGESAIFTVEAYTKASGTAKQTFTVVVPNGGSVTLKDLLIGQPYTITESGSWTWRYTPSVKAGSAPASGQISAIGTTVTFVNNRDEDKWLSDESGIVNTYDSDGTMTQEPID